ncbi:MAG TPA: acyl-CoA dehydrogenase family protein [Burkholderiales bacterium]|nr:acyl-CoA dehydrogenase family protein [Burkholderiales bacterium]
MTQDMLADSVERLLADCCTPQRIRQIEAGAAIDALWRALHDSGFMDALVPEAKGGAGLSLRDVFSVFYACGQHAVPAPMAQTLMVRAILATSGSTIPSGPMTIAAAMRREGNDGIGCARVPYGRVAEWVLVDESGSSLLLPTKESQTSPTGVHASQEAEISWRGIPNDALRIDAPLNVRALGACLYAAQLAGAMARVLDITTRYANERAQFGRSISKFQVIQHQLSVMAEYTFAARMAAQMGCESASHLPNADLAAVAKARTSEAALIVASIGHAVHGAMGFTAEYELQLYTRRLHEWRTAYGSESYWNERVGTALLAQQATTVDFIRARLFPLAE